MLLQLHCAQVGGSRRFFVWLGTVALHLLHLGLYLRLSLCFVHALADEYVHEQDLLLIWRNRCVLLHLVLSRMALYLQMLSASGQCTTHLAGRFFTEGAMHIVS